jgi:hypothetical protein
LVALVEIVTVFWDEERPTEKMQKHVVLPGYGYQPFWFIDARCKWVQYEPAAKT